MMDTSSPQHATAAPGPLLAALAAQADAAGAFGRVSVASGRLTCAAAQSAEPAEYRVDVQRGQLCVSLVTANRWLSQSIEQDLVHTGDKLADLLHDELVNLGYSGPPLSIEHYRSPEKLFTFITRLPHPASAWDEPATHESVFTVLRAYESCFAALGDMTADEGD
jgi:hypothetical protein